MKESVIAVWSGHTQAPLTHHTPLRALGSVNVRQISGRGMRACHGFTNTERLETGASLSSPLSTGTRQGSQESPEATSGMESMSEIGFIVVSITLKTELRG
jgi:hypothetical protein